MKKETRTVWFDAKGYELIVQKSQDEFYIPLSNINRETLQELAAAAYDATKPEAEDKP